MYFPYFNFDLSDLSDLIFLLSLCESCTKALYLKKSINIQSLVIEEGDTFQRVLVFSFQSKNHRIWIRLFYRDFNGKYPINDGSKNRECVTEA